MLSCIGDDSPHHNRADHWDKHPFATRATVHLDACAAVSLGPCRTTRMVCLLHLTPQHARRLTSPDRRVGKSDNVFDVAQGRVSSSGEFSTPGSFDATGLHARFMRYPARGGAQTSESLIVVPAEGFRRRSGGEPKPLVPSAPGPHRSDHSLAASGGETSGACRAVGITGGHGTGADRERGLGAIDMKRRQAARARGVQRVTVAMESSP
jgi:hypothetical protein